MCFGRGCTPSSFFGGEEGGGKEQKGGSITNKTLQCQARKGGDRVPKKMVGASSRDCKGTEGNQKPKEEKEPPWLVLMAFLAEQVKKEGTKNESVEQ